jgi:UDP-GlcNAc:undecaprenyl-phosphate GlcNAc-1-phosphate transferase
MPVFNLITLYSDFFWAVLTALFATAMFISLLRPVASKLGLIDIPDARKQHQKQTPLIGGLAVYIGLMVALFIFIPVSDTTAYMLSTASLVMLIGLIDDIKDLGVKVRLLVQVTASLIMINGTGLYIESLGNLFGFGEIRLGLWGIPFTVLAVIGVINAFNMVDGIDGLAGGLSLVAILSILGYETLYGHYLNVEYLILLAVALIPFLLTNLGTLGARKIFMGDAGSMFLGYVIAWTLINLSQGENRVIEPVNALWCAAIPIIDTLGVMVRRIKKKQSPFKPDREHLHHIFMRAGLSDKKTLGLLLSTALMISGLGLLVAQLAPALVFYFFAALFILYAYLLTHAWALQKLIKRI